MDQLSKAFPEFEIEFRGESRRVPCTFRVFRDFQVLTGKNPFDSSVIADFGPAEMASLVFCALRRDMPKLKLDEVIDELGADSMTISGRMIKEFFDSVAAKNGNAAEGAAQSK